MVKFRSGWVSGPYKRDQIRWNDIGDDWDAVAVEYSTSAAETAARPRNGSYT
jgi:hypothetical protein